MTLPDITKVQEQATQVFGHVPSITSCGDSLALVADGRLYLWDNVEACFRILLSIPKTSGKVDLVTVPFAIRAKADIRAATISADKLFRASSVWPTGVNGWGYEFEDLLMKICMRLGFANALTAEKRISYTVRQGTLFEDDVQKADLVLTVPGLTSGEILQVPLQIKTSTNNTGGSRDFVKSGQVAYIALSRFCPRSQQEALIRNAAAGSKLELWIVGQIIAGAIQAYTGHYIRFPAMPRPLPSWVDEEMFKKHFIHLLKPEIKPELTAIRVAPKVKNQVSPPKQVQVLTFLENYFVQVGSPYRPELFS